MKALEFKSFDIREYKSDDSGNLIINGYGAIFDNVDDGDDKIIKGAFAETLIKRAGRIAFCFQHDLHNAIGKILEIREDEKGLFLSVMISAAEDDIQIKIKEGIYKEMSIGYRVLDSKDEVIDGKTIRVITKILLYEVSIVTIAMNEYAGIESMKSEERKDLIDSEFNRLIAIVRNENLNFEIRRLKEITLSVLAQKTEPPKEEISLKADSSIIFDANFFTNNLNL